MERIVKAPGFRILVKMKPIEKEAEKISDGGIVLEVRTKSKLQREQEAMTIAYVEQVGRTAYKAYDDGEPWCKKGDLVLISKYSGSLVDQELMEQVGVTDLDPNFTYRVINDEDVHLVFTEKK